MSKTKIKNYALPSSHHEYYLNSFEIRFSPQKRCVYLKFKLYSCFSFIIFQKIMRNNSSSNNSSNMPPQTALLNQPMNQQYMLQQQINSLNNFNTPQYFQEPYLSIPIPQSYMPPYYGMPPNTHNMMYHQIQQQQQQQQQLGTSPSTGLNSGPPPPPPLPPTLIKNQNGRPLTPQQNQDSQYQSQNNFPYYPNYAAFDPNSAAAQLIMPNSRNINSGVRLISPMLLNGNGNQSKFLPEKKHLQMYQIKEIRF